MNIFVQISYSPAGKVLFNFLVFYTYPVEFMKDLTFVLSIQANAFFAPARSLFSWFRVYDRNFNPFCSTLLLHYNNSQFFRCTSSI